MRAWLDQGNGHRIETSPKVLDVVKHLLWVNDDGKKNWKTNVNIDSKSRVVGVRVRIEHTYGPDIFKECCVERSFESIDVNYMSAFDIAVRMLDEALEHGQALIENRLGVA